MAEIRDLDPERKVCLEWCGKSTVQITGNVGWCDEGNQRECSETVWTVRQHFFELPNLVAKSRRWAQGQRMKN